MIKKKCPDRLAMMGKKANHSHGGIQQTLHILFVFIFIPVSLIDETPKVFADV